MLGPRLVLLTFAIAARALAAQVGPVVGAAIEAASSPLASPARGVYDRAGGMPSTIGGTLAIGVGTPTFRVLLTASAAPATLPGTGGSQAADRQSVGLRLEALHALGVSWHLVGAGSISRQRLVRTWVAPLPGGELDPIAPPGPGQRSDEFLSWSGTGVQLVAGFERRLTRRLRARVLAGGAYVTSQAGNWERYTTARGGGRVSPSIELGLVSLFGGSR